MIIAAVAVIPNGAGFYGLKDSKRGLIMPGGKYEPEKDKTFHHTAAREALEEIGIAVDITQMQYLWHGPDGTGDFLCFAFWCPVFDHSSRRSEYAWERVTVQELSRSVYAGWYSCLFDVMKSRGLLYGNEIVRDT